jgi:hypothetical protein
MCLADEPLLVQAELRPIEMTAIVPELGMGKPLLTDDVTRVVNIVIA